MVLHESLEMLKLNNINYKQRCNYNSKETMACILYDGSWNNELSDLELWYYSLVLKVAGSLYFQGRQTWNPS